MLVFSFILSFFNSKYSFSSFSNASVLLYPHGNISGHKPFLYTHSLTIHLASSGSTSDTLFLTSCQACLVSRLAQLHNLFLLIFINACASASHSWFTSESCVSLFLSIPVLSVL